MKVRLGWIETRELQCSKARIDWKQWAREGQGQSIFVQPEPGMVVRLREREMYPVSAQSSSVVIMVEGVEGVEL